MINVRSKYGARGSLDTDSRVLVLFVFARGWVAVQLLVLRSTYRMSISCMNISYTTRKVRLKYGARVVFLFDGFVVDRLPTTNYRL